MQKKKSKKFSDYLIKLVRHYRYILNLNHWEIYVYENPTLEKEDECYTKIHYRNDGYLKATLEWDKELSKQTKQTIERSVIHELLHLVFRDYEAVAKSRFINENQLENENEKMTDHLAIVIHRILTK